MKIKWSRQDLSCLLFCKSRGTRSAILRARLFSRQETLSSPSFCPAAPPPRSPSLVPLRTQIDEIESWLIGVSAFHGCSPFFFIFVLRASMRSPHSGCTACPLFLRPLDTLLPFRGLAARTNSFFPKRRKSPFRFESLYSLFLDASPDFRFVTPSPFSSFFLEMSLCLSYERKKTLFDFQSLRCRLDFL